MLPNGEVSPIDTAAELFKLILTGFLGRDLPEKTIAFCLKCRESVQFTLKIENKTRKCLGLE